MAGRINQRYLALNDSVVNGACCRVLSALLPRLLLQTETHAVLSDLGDDVGHVGHSVTPLLVIVFVFVVVALARVRPWEAVRRSLCRS